MLVCTAGQVLSLAHTTKFFLTSSLVAIHACVYNEHVFSPQVLLDKFYLLVCTAGQVFLDDDVRARIRNSLSSLPCRHMNEQFSLLKSWHDQLLNKARCQGKTCHFMLYTRAYI